MCMVALPAQGCLHATFSPTVFHWDILTPTFSHLTPTPSFLPRSPEQAQFLVFTLVLWVGKGVPSTLLADSS